MATITVRFRGICCFIDKTNGESFNKRVVLPNGKGPQHGDHEKHLPIIEYFADDLKYPPEGLKRADYTRPGDSAQYQRIELDEPMHIELLGSSPLGPVPEGKITAGLNLPDSLIHLEELVEQKLQLKRTLRGPAMQVDPNLVVAVIDLPKGVLMAGPPEPVITKFPNSPKFSERRAARWLEHMFVVGGEFGLRLTPLGGQSQPEAKEIWFKSSTRLITIANEPLRYIVGHFVAKPEKLAPAPAVTMDMGTPAGNSTGHFDMYWDLIADPPARPRPIPEPSLGLGPGCSPSNIP